MSPEVVFVVGRVKGGAPVINVTTEICVIVISVHERDGTVTLNCVSGSAVSVPSGLTVPGGGGPVDGVVVKFPGNGDPGDGVVVKFPWNGDPGDGVVVKFPGNGDPGVGVVVDIRGNGDPEDGIVSEVPENGCPGVGVVVDIPGNGDPEDSDGIVSELPENGCPGVGVVVDIPGNSDPEKGVVVEVSGEPGPPGLLVSCGGNPNGVFVVEVPDSDCPGFWVPSAVDPREREVWPAESDGLVDVNVH